MLDTQNAPPKMSNVKNRAYRISATPATTGVNARTIGTNLAITIALPPCFS